VKNISFAFTVRQHPHFSPNFSQEQKSECRSVSGQQTGSTAGQEEGRIDAQKADQPLCIPVRSPFLEMPNWR